MTQHHQPRSSRPFSEYRDTPIWRALEELIMELGATGELSINTAPEYIVGYLCRELVAKKVVAAPGVGA